MHPELATLFSLSGRLALVTGGSSGIGRAIAVALGRAGARVAVAARGAAALDEVVAELQGQGTPAERFVADLSTRQGAHALADAVLDGPGAPDILVTAAAVNLRPPLAELTEAQWDATLTLNLDAPFVLGQRFGPPMAARGWGRIVHLASQQTVRAFGNSGAYGVSKAAIAGLTRSQAEAWSGHGVCVNAIAPGFVRTPLTEPVFADPDRVRALARRTMVGRNGVPEDFAAVAVLLAGEGARYLTGQVLFVDGGFSAT